MRLMIIRHGDPDYERDSLTPQGWREAECLAERLCGMDFKDIYVSPLGRAKDTAAPTLKKLGRTATECDWLREFPPLIDRPDAINRQTIAWDWLPADWTAEERFFQYDHWFENEVMARANVKEVYDGVAEGLDGILAAHGYVRDGHIYRAKEPNMDTLVFFCHLGVEGVMLSHLLNVSPMVLWHGTCALTTSVTTLITEERRRGAAYFRINCFGDTYHLYSAGEKPSFSARFRECYDNEDERKD